jgi:hypothetical protein
MAMVLAQERSQNKRGVEQYWQESVGRKEMTVAEWGKHLLPFPFFILLW